MDLDFSEEQEMLREMVRGVCATYAPLETVRALEDDPVGYPTELWSQLAELDLLGLLVPVEHGGSGMTALEGVVVYEELGRSLAPSPHFVSAVLAAGVLVRAGSAAQQAAWLGGITSGTAIVSTAWLEPHNGFGPKGVQATATPAGGDGAAFTIDGTKRHVPFASSAAAFIVPARVGPGVDDVDLFLVEATSSGIEVTQEYTIQSDCQHRVAFVGTPAERLGAAGTGWATWHQALLEGAVLLAAQAVGGAREALALTTQYAKDREQFGKPLGAFQSISHYLADAKTAVDGAALLVYEAAWALANGHSVEKLAPMAKLFACQTYRDVTAMAQQVFGGVGFTLEYDIQLYFRRAKALQLSWWDDQFLRELIAVEVLDQPA